MNHYPEILAPCGTFESLEAAVKAGADAVYLGGDLFSARAFAGNFDTEALLAAIDHCHIYDVKIYMALNTLLKDDEIGRVREYVRPFYRAGLDGVIVQDMGVVNVLKNEYPDLPLHASTQMSVSSAYGAQVLKDLGFTRVVPARELSLAEIRSIKEKVDIEIECFVHGAMCFAYSGKCLMSSFIGGRSGNRGRCAQPCRQRWSLQADTENGTRQVADQYVMSLKDMCTLEVLPELIAARIDSFKIEGRMKKPEYTASTVAAYRMARDMYLSGLGSEAQIRQAVTDMKDIYNRGGFSEGYYFRQNGPDMLSPDRPNHTGVFLGTVTRIEPPYLYVRTAIDVNAQDVCEFRTDGMQGTGSDVPTLTTAEGAAKGSTLRLKGNDFKRFRKGMEVYRIRNNALLSRIEEEIIAPERQVSAQAHVTAHMGSPLVITISAADGRDIQVSCSGSIVEEASSQPSSAAVIAEKMQKTGGSGVRLDVTCDIDINAFIRMSELNNLRRQAVSDFKDALAAAGRRV